MIEFARIKEILSDAESCARLTEWEESFCDSMRTKALSFGDRMKLSDKQDAALLRIEEKVYST